MAQLIVAVGLTVCVVIFSMSNTHHVDLGWVVGEPIRIRLIFLLVLSFVGGGLSTVFYQLVGRVLQQAQLRQRQRFAMARSARESSQ